MKFQLLTALRSFKTHASILVLILSIGVSCQVYAQDRAQRWQQFSKSLAAMHEQRTRETKCATSETVGGYGGTIADPAFYTEVRYVEKATGRLLAQVKTENKPPHLPHVMQLYVYDDKGRLKREYTAAYLPDRSETPVQTLIDIYAYADGLQAYRQFNASDELIYEQCLGEFEGKPVRIAWEDLDIPDKIESHGDEAFRKSYQACFQTLDMTAGPYLDPMNELK